MNCKKCIYYRACKIIDDGIALCCSGSGGCEIYKGIDEIAEMLTENADRQRRIILCSNGLPVIALTAEQYQEAKTENIKWLENVLQATEKEV